MIVKHAQPRKWTTVDRRTINDERLSFRARGVLVWLLDKPPEWEVRSISIAAGGVEGRDAVRQALRELESFDYIVREKHQAADGRWYTETWVYERPEDAPGTDSQASVTGNQASVNRASVSQALTSSSLISTTEPIQKAQERIGEKNRRHREEDDAALEAEGGAVDPREGVARIRSRQRARSAA